MLHDEKFIKLLESENIYYGLRKKISRFFGKFKCHTVHLLIQTAAAIELESPDVILGVLRVSLNAHWPVAHDTNNHTKSHVPPKILGCGFDFVWLDPPPSIKTITLDNLDTIKNQIIYRTV